MLLTIYELKLISCIRFSNIGKDIINSAIDDIYDTLDWNKCVFNQIIIQNIKKMIKNDFFYRKKI